MCLINTNIRMYLKFDQILYSLIKSVNTHGLAGIPSDNMIVNYTIKDWTYVWTRLVIRKPGGFVFIRMFFSLRFILMQALCCAYANEVSNIARRQQCGGEDLPLWFALRVECDYAPTFRSVILRLRLLRCNVLKLYEERKRLCKLTSV